MPTNPLIKKYGPSKEEVEKLFQEIVGNFSFDLTTVAAVLNPEVNELVAGKVVGFKDSNVLVDLGCKTEGYLPAVEDGILEDLDIDDKIHVIVKNINSDQIFITRVGVETRLRKTELLETLAVGEIIKCKLVQFDKINWTVLIENCLEASLPHYLSGLNPSTDESLIGTELEAEISDIQNGVFILSRKAIAERERRLSKDSYLMNLESGMIVDGIIKNITAFGSFIQLVPGVFGLCHVSDHGNTPIVKNKKVKVKVLKIDKEKNKIALSIKAATEPSWDELVAKHAINDIVSVTVKSIVNYGVFVELESGLQGLLHISDLSWSGHVKHPKELLSEGQVLDVKILGIDTGKKRISLGLKQMAADPWDSVSEKYLVGSSLVGNVVTKNSHGTFIELEPGIEGLLVDKKTGVSLGDQVTVIIKKIDLGAKKITLSKD